MNQEADDTWDRRPKCKQTIFSKIQTLLGGANMVKLALDKYYSTYLMVSCTTKSQTITAAVNLPEYGETTSAV